MTAATRADLLAALAWQVELGVDEAIAEAPVDRYALATAPPASPPPAAAPAIAAAADPVAEAKGAAAAAPDLEALRAAIDAYPHCALKQGARSLVFADGQPGARTMILGEAPGQEEDREGRPFVGRAGQLLDRMLGAVGLSRTAPDPGSAVYITNVLPWRPPRNRDPKPDEIAMLWPFVDRHIALAQPDLVIAMGNIACQALLSKRGITRLRGKWSEALGRPVLPMVHPAYLLRNPGAKRETWGDLLEIRAWLDAH